MIVVDTNLIGYLLLASDRSPQAEQAFRQDPEWAAPLLWRSELRNVLATQIRTQRISLALAQAIIIQAEDLIFGREYAMASMDVLRLAQESGCTAYDCEFIALAQTLNICLVTVDRKLLAAFPDIAVSLEDFIAEKS
jgi:predicted nucleic acid-binding protein